MVKWRNRANYGKIWHPLSPFVSSSLVSLETGSTMNLLVSLCLWAVSFCDSYPVTTSLAPHLLLVSHLSLNEDISFQHIPATISLHFSPTRLPHASHWGVWLLQSWFSHLTIWAKPFLPSNHKIQLRKIRSAIILKHSCRGVPPNHKLCLQPD